MKDSGVPWLGAVPAHWELLPALAVYKPRQVKNIGMVEKTVLSLSYGRIVFKPEEKLRGLVPESFETYQVVEPSNIIVRTTDLQNDRRSLRIGHAKDRGIITSAYLCLETTSKVENEFGDQYLNAYDLLKIIYGYGSGLRQNLDFQDIKRMPVLVPPKDEQAAIVRFLDHADRRIRKAILGKQKLIKLLEEQKQAIIHRAVTRGLDPNVRLRPSGVEWLGDLPEHWETLPVRRLVSFVTSGSRGWANYYTDSGYIFLQSGNLGRSMSLNLAKIQHVSPPSGAEGERTRVQRNDVLVCITGALTGNVALVEIDFPMPAFINQHVALLRPRDQLMLPRFLALALHSEIGKSQFKTNEYGGTKQGLGLNDVKSVFVPIPPTDEQALICKALEEETKIVVSTVAKAEEEIALLREYRTRLVSDVVIGKLDVREAASRLPDEIEPIDAALDDDGLTEGDEIEGEAAEVDSEDQAA